MRGIVATILAKLIGDRSGGVFVYFAIAAPVLIGLAGASIDIGLWYANKRLVQSAVDSAALAGALEVLRSNDDDDAIVAAVNLDAANNGYSSGNGDTVTVDTSNSPQIEVIITRPTPGLLSQVVFTEQTDVSARAVAEADVIDSCVWSLNPSASGAVSVSGNAQVTLGCGVVANSNNGSGINESGSGCLTASKLKVVGGAGGNCLNPTPQTGIPPITDPLAALEGPSVGPCDFNGNDAKFNSNNGPDPIILAPGVYCGGITINTSRNVIFSSGLYILNDAALSISGQANVTGTDVSFYLTPNGGPNDDITISGGASATLSAPNGGELPGILFYHDRGATGNITHNLTGGATMQLEGIVYFPSVDMVFSGGALLQSAGAIIIADEISFTGNAFLGGFENSPILGNPLLIRARLLE